MDSNVKSFLSDLQELNDANIVKIQVPSTGKKVPFTLMSINQQKKLIRSAFDGVDGIVERANILNNIITDNSKSDVEFLLTDKNSILLNLRKKSIGSVLKIDGEMYDIADLPELDKTEFKLTDTLSTDSITVDVRVPTLKLDSEINTKLEKELAKIQKEDEKVKQSVDIVISYEITKYVDTVTMGDVAVKFDDISAYERKEIVLNLPLALNNKILEYIATVKKATDKTITFSEEVVVEFDASFLSTD